MQQKKEAKSKEADRCIELLLGILTSSEIPGDERGDNSIVDASTSSTRSIPSKKTLVIRIKQNGECHGKIAREGNDHDLRS